MGKKVKLKPCPFCGAKANLVNVRERWAVECSKKCVGTVWKSVINYWNRTINPPYCMICGQALDWSDENEP